MYTQNKPILQYDSEGNFIKEWKGVREAQTVLNFHNISKCCKENRPIKGFIFKYKENDNFPLKIDVFVYFEKNVIYQISKETGEIINEYRNSRSASQETGYHNGSICACLKGKKLEFKNYIWVYKREYSLERIKNIQKQIQENNTESSDIVLKNEKVTHYKSNSRKDSRSIKNGNRAGIYMWYNNVSDKRYIGQSVDLERRYKAFLNFKYNNYAGTKINNARKKYNEEHYWEYNILEYIDNVDDLDEREIYYIEKYNTLNDNVGYNEVLGDLVTNINHKIDYRLKNWCPVIQYNMEGDFIRMFETQECLKSFNYNPKEILYLCFFHNCSEDGYLWRLKNYNGEIVKKISKRNKRYKKIYEVDTKTGDVIKVHNSLRDVIKTYPEIAKNSIHSALNDKKPRYGRLWLHEKDMFNEEYISNFITQYNRPYSEKYRKYRISNFPKILQYDLNGNFIRSWDFIKDAQDALGLHNISTACNSNSKTDGGYIWKFQDTDDIPQIINTDEYVNKYKCYQISEITGEILAEYESATDAQRKSENSEIRFNFSSISACLRGENLKYKGYIWILKKDYSEDKVREIQEKIKAKNIKNDISLNQIDIKTGNIIKT